MTTDTRTLVQCDFDGTVAVEDISFAILAAFANGDWRGLFQEYKDGKITVGDFNAQAFSMVKADKTELMRVVRNNTKIRPGFREMVDYCAKRGFRFVIVSNGLDFYIESILRELGLSGTEYYAASTEFQQGGMKVKYIAPDGSTLDDDFKGTYGRMFLSEGYRVIYIGDGTSDIDPARQCDFIFATDSLLEYCRQESLNHAPFTDFNQVMQVMETWQ